MSSADLAGWNREQLIEHIQTLERQLEVVRRQQRKQELQAAHAVGVLEPEGQAKAADGSEKAGGKKRNDARPFDFAKHRARHVALKLAYFGDAYYGFSSASGDNVPTVEAQLFRALHTSKLVPESLAAVEAATSSTDDAGQAAAGEPAARRAAPQQPTMPQQLVCGWSRCGRTDKGVSAFEQVVSLWIRTSRPADPGTKTWAEVAEWVQDATAGQKWMRPEEAAGKDALSNGNPGAALAPASDSDGVPELPYLNMLNRLLPPDIRVLAWSPVDDTFDARFTCTHRKYNYFFDAAGLDVAAMQRAAELFVGTHDCRHICKIDSTKAARDKYFVRTIMECSIVPARELAQGSPGEDGQAVHNGDGDSGDAGTLDSASDRFHALVVRGRAFLWHQVRNMMALLLLVGKGLEQPEVVSHMLDLSQHPPNAGRPFYDMAADTPLVLVECAYPAGMLAWRVRDDGSLDPAAPARPGRQPKGVACNDVRVMGQLVGQWQASTIRSLQLATLVRRYTAIGSVPPSAIAPSGEGDDAFGPTGLGRGAGVGTGRAYVKLAQRKRCDSVEDVVRKQTHLLAQKKQRKRALASSGDGSGDGDAVPSAASGRVDDPADGAAGGAAMDVDGDGQPPRKRPSLE
ncbi:pseudouridine synthase deg1 [Polyrhizophydium stewartii]|uniref:Pseudouridine synthase deg1 n=1 Tax=Polyrhizophydium stewartii TaxID=2732419 RepID=A0ABR4N507_9FUNG|nr:hypothetical protein HK105_003524 [Polyrhizophydium stewartii]